MAVGTMMETPSAEELELQEQVVKALESQGMLGKIKAQLRAAVFDAIHGTGGNSTGGGLLSSRPSKATVLPSQMMLQSFGMDGQIAIEIVRNFLECLELDHTLSVFLAEASVDKRMSEWRMPARLCERVSVLTDDEQTPVLVKMLRQQAQNERQQSIMKTSSHVVMTASSSMGQRYVTSSHSIEKTTTQSELPDKLSATRAVVVPPPQLDLPPPPPVVLAASVKEATKEEEEEDSELEASMAEEVASGSFDESLVEEQSASVSEGRSRQREDHVTSTRRRADSDICDEQPPTIASPPPVLARLSALPHLPGMAGNRAKPSYQEEEDDDDDRQPKDTDDEGNLDEDEAAARLRSLEAKMKEMEAEDETGVLQQLKGTAGDDSNADAGRPKPTTTQHEDDDDEEEEAGEDDNYGSDFEEEVEEEEEEEEEVASEISESVLSESEDVAPVKHVTAFQNDKQVDSEDALNSYDYIEAVEKD